jgi:hypothetical protein
MEKHNFEEFFIGHCNSIIKYLINNRRMIIRFHLWTSTFWSLDRLPFLLSGFWLSFSFSFSRSQSKFKSKSKSECNSILLNGPSSSSSSSSFCLTAVWWIVQNSDISTTHGMNKRERRKEKNATVRRIEDYLAIGTQTFCLWTSSTNCQKLHSSIWLSTFSELDINFWSILGNLEIENL